MKFKRYTLTETADQDFEGLQKWALYQWNVSITNKYIEDIHESAQFIAENQSAVSKRKDLVLDTNLGIYPVREHYLVFVPYSIKHIIIVSIIHQTRDVPRILNARKFVIDQEVREIEWLIANKKLIIEDV